MAKALFADCMGIDHAEATRTYPITLESLTAYQQSAMRNAVALVEEAQLLYEAGHYARTYFLAEAAIEEAGKRRKHLAAIMAVRPLLEGLLVLPAGQRPHCRSQRAARRRSGSRSSGGREP